MKKKIRAPADFEMLLDRYRAAYHKREGVMISVRDIAEEAGVSHGTLYNILRGSHVPTMSTISKIATTLGISYDRVADAIDRTLDA